MVLKYKFCLWLIDALMIRPLTLIELQSKWIQSSTNADGDSLSERTFNRYRRDTEELMQVEISCDKRNGNKYFIANKDYFEKNKMLEWILTSYRLSNVTKDLKNKSVVVMDFAPPGANLLEPILNAVENNRQLEFIYKSHYQELKKVQLLPVFVRLCHQRWYVIGINLESMKQRVYAFERMHTLITSTEASKLNKSLTDKIKPADYFADSYGVINEGEPTLIQIRAFWPQNAYLKGVPLHHSQEVILEHDDYTDFGLYVRPTYDFIQAILSNREKVIVLGPNDFKAKIISILKAMQISYETRSYCESPD